MERHTRSYEKDKKTRKARKRTLTGGSSENTTGGSRTSSAASSRERSASTSSRLSTKSANSTAKNTHKSAIVSGSQLRHSLPSASTSSKRRSRPSGIVIKSRFNERSSSTSDCDSTYNRSG